MEVEENEDWKPLCESSLLKDHLPTLEKICENDYNGKDEDFLKCFMKPFVLLLDSMKSAVEQHRGSDVAWSDHFERLVKYIIHPTILKISLHKGDFYIHVSATSPRKLQIKYYDSGTIQSKTLATDDCIDMCSENWAENLRKEAKNRFVYSNCIIWSNGKLDRKSWRNVLSAPSQPPELRSQTSFLREDSTEVSQEAKELLLAELDEQPLHILELNFEILHSQVAYLPGTRDKRGGAVIIVRSNDECWENPDISCTELAKLFLYYHKIPRSEVQKSGCSIVIDARQGKRIKNTLEYIGEGIALFQEKIPGAVNMAYVITRKDSLLLLIGAGTIRGRLNFEFQLISNLSKLYEAVPREQLPVEFGGELEYNHEKWIKFRTNLEPFMTGCRSAAKHAIASINELASVKLGDSVDECKALLEKHIHWSQRVLEDSRLVNLLDEGKKIMERLQEPIDNALNTMDYEDTVECVHSLYKQINHLFDKFQNFSNIKTKKLELQLQYITFFTECPKMCSWLETEGIPFLESHSDTGDSIGHVTSLQAEFAHFEANAKEKLEQTLQIINTGKSILNSQRIIENEKVTIREKMDKLEDLYENITFGIDNRKKKLTQAIQFYTLYEKASDWSLQCLRYIAQMNMEDLQTIEGTQKLKNELDSFLLENKPLGEKEMARMTELAHHLENEKLKMQAGQISGRCSEVEEMINKKYNTIKSAEKRLQAVPSYASSESSSGICSKDDDLATECGDENEEGMGPTFSWKNEAEREYEENDELLLAYDALISPKMKERLRFIAEEMIQTEKGYVLSLEYILHNYVPEMDKPCLPPTLAGKKNILFGNIGRIYDFHKRYFSQELENYQHAPLQVGKCFLRWERQFYVYALYNKNKPKSDGLLEDFGNAFFATKQTELKDKLNLASYLIKPVQRLGKYALLLRDMANCCTQNDPRLSELLAAQDMIKFQLRHGNDLLAMDSIRESDVNLKEQGCLLRQADFSVYNGRKKRLRRVFLFEDLILFSKAKKQVVQGDCFICKSSLKTADLGLTENIGDSGLRFEVWYRRWRKSKKTESYVLQATSTEIKNAWVTDIRRILMNQAQRNKEYGRSEITTGISVESQPSGLYSEHITSTQVSPTNQVSRTKSEYHHPKSEPNQTNQNKRLSWISSDSANTSGVHDLGFNAESDVMSSEEKPQRRVTVKTSQSFTSARQVSTLDHKDTKRINESTTANALVDMPVVQVRTRNNDETSTFVRNTIKRRTLHIDFAINEDRRSPERHNYATRTKSSPATEYLPTEKYHSHMSREVLDETEEELSLNDQEDGSSTENRSTTPYETHKQSNPATTVKKSVDSTPVSPTIVSSPQDISGSTSSLPPSNVTPSVSNISLSSCSPAVSAEFSSKEVEQKKSKEKTKDKPKKKKISIGAMIGRKKKSSSSSSDNFAGDG